MASKCMICAVVERCETNERAALQIATLVAVMTENKIAMSTQMCERHHAEYLERIVAITELMNKTKALS